MLPQLYIINNFDTMSVHSFHILQVAIIFCLVFFSWRDIYFLLFNSIGEKIKLWNNFHRLPSNTRFMPSIGNGHLAATIFGDTIYMNGLYNGRTGRSHRARIPNWANIRLNSTLSPHHNSLPVYSLDTKEGVFKVKVDGARSVVTQRVYAHRYYTRSIVNQIKVVAKPHGKLLY